jgi:hypothetical protein
MPHPTPQLSASHLGTGHAAQELDSPQDSNLIPEGLELLWSWVNNL